MFTDILVEPLDREALLFVIDQLRDRYARRYPAESAQRMLADILFDMLAADVRASPNRGKIIRSMLRDRELYNEGRFPKVKEHRDDAIQDAPRALATALKKAEGVRSTFTIGSATFEFWVTGPRPMDRGEEGRGTLFLSISYELTDYRDHHAEAKATGRRSLSEEPERVNREITNPTTIGAAGVLDEDGSPLVLITWDGGHGPHTYFEVFRNGYLIAETTEPRFIDRSVEVGAPYLYNVRACNEDGCAAGCSSTVTALLPINRVS